MRPQHFSVRNLIPDNTSVMQVCSWQVLFALIYLVDLTGSCVPSYQYLFNSFHQNIHIQFLFVIFVLPLHLCSQVTFTPDASLSLLAPPRTAFCIHELLTLCFVYLHRSPGQANLGALLKQKNPQASALPFQYVLVRSLSVFHSGCFPISSFLEAKRTVYSQ